MRGAASIAARTEARSSEPPMMVNVPRQLISGSTPIERKILGSAVRPGKSAGVGGIRGRPAEGGGVDPAGAPLARVVPTAPVRGSNERPFMMSLRFIDSF